MKVDFDPTRCACDILAMVLRPPPLHKAHANCAHFCEFVDGLKALVHTLCQELGEVLIVEDFQAAPRRNLTHSGCMKSMGVVAVVTLDKNGSITQAFSEDLTSNVKQVHTLPYVTSDILNGGVSVNIGEQA